MSERRKRNRAKGRPELVAAYKCPFCGCTTESTEMGEFKMQWHYEGCPDWHPYTNAGRAAQSQ